MGFQLTNHSDCVKLPNCLTYDADNVTLVGRYVDELTAYRFRREWVDILAGYFLLERERDYDIAIDCEENSKKETVFLLKATFNSACGRYAFWRLINRQAPDAEQLLGGRSGKTTDTNDSIFNTFLSKNEDLDYPWFMDDHMERKSWCSNLLSSAFNKINRLL